MMEQKMNPESREEDTEKALSAIEKAYDKLTALCHGERWTLSIPADRNNDPDLVIGDALLLSRTALSRLAAPKPEEHDGMVDDLAMMIRVLVHKLGPENQASGRAIGLLKRHGLLGSPLRDEPAATKTEGQDERSKDGMCVYKRPLRCVDCNSNWVCSRANLEPAAPEPRPAEEDK